MGVRRLRAAENAPFHGGGQTTFLFAKRKAFWISKEKWPIGVVPPSISAVRVGTVEASIERCRFSSACGTARIPIRLLLPCFLEDQPLWEVAESHRNRTG